MLARLAWTLLTWHRFPGWRERLAEIRRIAHLSPEALGAWQAEALRRHLAWATGTIPYFRARTRPGAHLADFPVLTRDTLQAHELDLRDPTRPASALTRETSGGSTGNPVAVWQDLAYRVHDQATEIHLTESWGLEPWCRRAYVWGADRDLAELTPRERLYLRLFGWVVVDAFRMSEGAIRDAVTSLEAQGPAYLQGYASALELLAEWLLANRPHHRVRPQVIRSSAEMLTPTTRRTIERAFGVRVCDFYGSRESASIAAQCPAGTMHVQAHGRVVELVDDDGHPTPPGKPGRVLVTDLTNRAFGLIRYETGDVATWPEDARPCACGSAYPRLASILGRKTDFITTPGGDLIHGEWFTHLFYGRGDVTRFQVYQPSLDRLELRTVGTATEVTLAALLSDIRARVGEAVEVTWQPVEDIETTRSGKYRFTISDVPFHAKASS